MRQQLTETITSVTTVLPTVLNKKPNESEKNYCCILHDSVKWPFWLSGITNTFLPLSYFCIHLNYVQSPWRRRKYVHLKHWNRHLLCGMKIWKTTTVWAAAMKIWRLTAAVQLPGCSKLKQNAPSQQTVCWIIVNVVLDSELDNLCQKLFIQWDLRSSQWCSCLSGSRHPGGSRWTCLQVSNSPSRLDSLTPKDTGTLILLNVCNHSRTME